MDEDGQRGRKTEPPAGEPVTRGSMSQRRSGKTLLFKMAPRAATEAADLQRRARHGIEHLQQRSEGSVHSEEAARDNDEP